MRNHRLLYLITLSFFILGFVNIHFSLLGVICMTLPFYLLYRLKRKIWCQGYCPRAALYSSIGKQKKWRSFKTPSYFIHGEMKWIMLTYFGISLFFILMTTIAVAKGIRQPMNYLRFLVMFPIPFSMPQIITFNQITPWITHLSYRIYSMMMTTTLLGIVLAVVYKPRTWCTICPIATISDTILKK